MNKKKVKFFAIPFAVASLCTAGVVAGTFAYFTSRDQADVSIEAGQVKVSFEVTDIEISSLGVVQTATKEVMIGGELVEVKVFENGGYAYFDGAKIYLNKITPGDKVKAVAKIKNDSNVKIAYHLAANYVNESTGRDNGYVPHVGDNVTATGKLSDAMVCSFEEAYYYNELEASAQPVDEEFSLELPALAGDAYQGATSTFVLEVNAIQWNGYEGRTVPMGINSENAVVAKDSGYYHETEVDGHKIDMIGYDEVDGKFAKVSSKTYGTGANAVTYKGMVYNRSLINHIASINVNFTGDDLYCVFTEYLMEDMDFEEVAANKVTSGVDFAIKSPRMAYFVLYTSGEVEISSMTINYRKYMSMESSMVYNNNSALLNARSMGKNVVREESYLEFDNNPLVNTNNYSTGSHSGNNDTWYRWNGKTWGASGNLGKEFTLHVTIMGNISQVVNPDSYFNFSVWPELHIDDDRQYAKDWTYVYIGNDNYEPLGKDSPDRVHQDTYADYSYAGRFFTDYKDYGAAGWQFADPDTTLCKNSTKTYREAYETYTLPFWNVEFKFYESDEEGGRDIFVDTFINGFQINHYWMFDEYEDQDININTMHMHAVNYGNPDGSPAASYHAFFTYPRID